MKFANGMTMNDLLLSAAKAMGATPTVNGMSNISGDPALCKGPLAGLTA